MRLTDVPGISGMKIRVMTHRKANDQYVEGKQSVNYQGMAFDFHYHHWDDARHFYDRIKDESVRRLGAMFALDNVREETQRRGPSRPTPRGRRPPSSTRALCT